MVLSHPNPNEGHHSIRAWTQGNQIFGICFLYVDYIPAICLKGLRIFLNEGSFGTMMTIQLGSPMRPFALRRNHKPRRRRSRQLIGTNLCCGRTSLLLGGRRVCVGETSISSYTWMYLPTELILQRHTQMKHRGVIFFKFLSESLRQAIAHSFKYRCNCNFKS